jgi:hypothetical protein
MSPATLFRTLILASLALAILGGVVSLSPGHIPETWQQALDLHGDGGYWQHLESSAEGDDAALAVNHSVLGFIGLIILAVILIALWVGLFFFWRPSRTVNVVVTVLYAASLPWAGLSVYLPIQAMFAEISVLLQGAIIALSYSPPIKHLFEHRPGTAPPLPEG